MTVPGSPVRVLLCDDDPLVRSGLRLILAAAPDIDVVAEAGSGEQAVELSLAHYPDVVLMDLRMPGIGGIEATRRLRALARPPRVLVLTTFDVDEVPVRALVAGADGFLLKTASEQIAGAIRAVASGDGAFSPETSRRLTAHIRAGGAPRQAEARRLVAELSPREREVVRLVGDGRSNPEIARALFIGEATVKTHLAAAQVKLGVTGRTQVAVLAERAGLLPP